MEKKRRRLLAHPDGCTDESTSSDYCTTDCDVFDVSDADIFAAIFDKLQPEPKGRKCPTIRPKLVGHTARRKKLPSDHRLSATKITYVITPFKPLGFTYRDHLEKTCWREKCTTAGVPSDLPRRPSSLTRFAPPNPPPHSQPNLSAQAQNIARNKSPRSVLKLPPQLRARCKRMSRLSCPTSSSSSSSPFHYPSRGCPHPQKRRSWCRTLQSEAPINRLVCHRNPIPVRTT
ncbi:hypothetical protein TcWFU_006903 [Taenia crassiceps]|uniref:Uncharacterized protein n=1 Tax=Taenia crassiceps TaxID=6207 RepID=A0ABR4PZC1_9CEST